MVALDSYLNILGYRPKWIRGVDLWYLSPFRVEETPSFKVNRERNIWYDHGVGKGGDIFTFAGQYYGIDYFPDIIFRISEDLGDCMTVQRKASAPWVRKRSLMITDVKSELDESMKRYLRSRSIIQPLALEKCSAVYYRVYGKMYRAIGFRNDSGGYELRNLHFKGSSSPKDITTIRENAPESLCCIFEGFMDYLSFLTIGPEKYDIRGVDCIVLNSVAHIHKAFPTLQHYSTVCSFLDNDDAGRNTFSFIEQNLPDVRDFSRSYVPYKDLNEYLCNNNRM